MKITITYYGVEHTINTKPKVDYMDENELDETNLPEAFRAFRSLLLSLTFCENHIDETFLRVENGFEKDIDDLEQILKNIKDAD